jgi:hypothetical protein
VNKLHWGKMSGELNFSICNIDRMSCYARNKKHLKFEDHSFEGIQCTEGIKHAFPKQPPPAPQASIHACMHERTHIHTKLSSISANHGDIQKMRILEAKRCYELSD